MTSNELAHAAHCQERIGSLKEAIDILTTDRILIVPKPTDPFAPHSQLAPETMQAIRMLVLADLNTQLSAAEAEFAAL